LDGSTPTVRFGMWFARSWPRRSSELRGGASAPWSDDSECRSSHRSPATFDHSSSVRDAWGTRDYTVDRLVPILKSQASFRRRFRPIHAGIFVC
jgi:hypothetical protein